MITMSRRSALQLSAAGWLGGCTTTRRTPRGDRSNGLDINTAKRLDASVSKYVQFGDHMSGSSGDLKTGDWMEAHFRNFGFETQRQAFRVPVSDGDTGTIRLYDESQIGLLHQPPTSPVDIHTSLCYWSPGTVPPDMRGRILVYDSHFSRHSSLHSPEWRQVIKTCETGRPAVLLAITNGPTGEAIRLNTSLSMQTPPIALVAPRDADNLRLAASVRQPATVKLTGKGGTRTASNVIARRKGTGPVLVLSTPLSGWGPCAAERGPGIAILRELASWLAANRPNLDLVCICASGHEYENLGAEAFLHAHAPEPSHTRLWVHLGAGLAARDWHERGGKLLPLPSPDPQRFLGVTGNLKDAAISAFNGRPGLEVVYEMTPQSAAGELKNILAAGYPSVIGAFSAHRFHHTSSDTIDKVDREELAGVYHAFLTTIESVLA